MAAVILLPAPQFSIPCCAIAAAAGGGGRRSHRLLSSLSAASDTSAASRLFRKFVASSSKSTALQALSLLISHSSPFSLQLYQTLSRTPWFQWNPKLTASLISLLEEHNRPIDAQTLISQSAYGLRSPRDLALFYCDLIDAFSNRGLKLPALQSYARLKEIPFSGRRPFESMVKGLCLMGMPADAEELLREMEVLGFKPSHFEFRSVFQAYGLSGAFAEMTRVIELMQEKGMLLDTVSFNTVLSCYGDHGNFSEMVSWIRKMRESEISFSARTFNSVLNSCPTVAMIIKDVCSLPLTTEALFRKVEEYCRCSDEAFLLRELNSLPLLGNMMEWSDSEGKLDLHGLHLASAYFIILQWMEEVDIHLAAEKDPPMELSIICGSGIHSKMRGESPVKKLVSQMMFQLNSPMKIDRKNVGRFVAKGNIVRDWLCSLPGQGGLD